MRPCSIISLGGAEPYTSEGDMRSPPGRSAVSAHSQPTRAGRAAKKQRHRPTAT